MLAQNWRRSDEKNCRWVSPAWETLRTDIYFAVEWLCLLTGKTLDDYLDLWRQVLSRCRLMNVFQAGTNASFSNRADFSCQCIKLVGKRQLDIAFQQELTFADHVHEFDAGQDAFGRSK